MKVISEENSTHTNASLLKGKRVFSSSREMFHSTHPGRAVVKLAWTLSPDAKKKSNDVEKWCKEISNSSGSATNRSAAHDYPRINLSMASIFTFMSSEGPEEASPPSRLEQVYSTEFLRAYLYIHRSVDVPRETICGASYALTIPPLEL